MMELLSEANESCHPVQGIVS